MTALASITPVIMIGGTGSRLWPLSRTNKPKQFLHVGGQASMFQNTLMRFQGPQFQPAWLLAGAETLNHVTAQLTELGLPAGGVVVEPSMRGTAAAIATIALILNEVSADSLVLVAPADHFIKDETAFRDAVLSAAPIAAAGSIVTFGITPTAPETGFGYIAGGDTVEVAGHAIGHRIGPSGFREKPDLETAKEFVEKGYLWNAGIFLFKASTMLNELIRYAPETLAAVAVARADATVHFTNTYGVVAPDAEAYDRAPLELSIDVAVMERTEKAVVVPCRSIGWNDIGSLSALWEISDKDAQGNGSRGDVMIHQSRNVFVHSESGRKTVAAHLDDILIVDTEDALIVLPTSQAQAVKTIVKDLKASGASQLRFAREASFAWGDVHLDHAGTEHTAMTLRLGKGKSLDRRSRIGFETWLVTKGTASVTIRDRTTQIAVGQWFTAVGEDTTTIAASDEGVQFALISSPLRGRSLEQFFASPAEQPELAVLGHLSLAPGREVA